MIELHRTGAVLLAMATILRFPAGEPTEADALPSPSIVGYWTMKEDPDPDGSKNTLEPWQLLPAEARHDALIGEIADLPSRLAIVPGPETIILVDQQGHHQRFNTSGEPERQRLNFGTVESITVWTGEELRQEFSWASDLAIIRTFSAAPDSEELVVTTWLEGPVPSDRRPMRRLYASDALR